MNSCVCVTMCYITSYLILLFCFLFPFSLFFFFSFFPFSFPFPFSFFFLFFTLFLRSCLSKALSEVRWLNCGRAEWVGSIHLLSLSARLSHTYAHNWVGTFFLLLLHNHYSLVLDKKKRRYTLLLEYIEALLHIWARVGIEEWSFFPRQTWIIKYESTGWIETGCGI